MKNLAQFELPKTLADLDARCTLKVPVVNLNDEVHDIFRVLWHDEKFRLLLNATTDKDSIEGATYVDDVVAAQQIRDYALTDGKNPFVGGKQVAAIVRSLKVVMRRHEMSRKDRAAMLDGMPVPNGDIDSDIPTE
jgi:hypothetical protein